MIWWVGLALALVPFTFGLVFIWRFKDKPASDGDTPSEIEVLGVTIVGPVGFTVFALGLLSGGYCVSQIAANQSPPPPAMVGALTGEVERVPDVLPLTGKIANRRQLRDWLKQFERARVFVKVGGEHHVRRGDYLALLADDAPKDIPKELANIDSDTTALLRVGGVAPAVVTAALDEFAVEEALTKLPDPVSVVEAVRKIEPVRRGQRVAVIEYDERNARDQLREQIRAANESSSEGQRRLHLRAVVDLADDFVFDHPGGFFAAEVLVAKGEAHYRLGEVELALATYRRFLNRFPASPRVQSVLDAMQTIARRRLMPEATPVAQPASTGARPDRTPVEPTFLLTTDRVQAPGSLAAARGARAIVPVRAIGVRASRTLRSQGRVDYDAANTLDGSLRTAWSEGAPGSGRGVSITFRFDDPYAVTTLRVVNGYAKSAKSFSTNARLRTVRVTTAKGTRTVRLRDTRRRQSLRIPAGATRSVRITIVDVYRGAFSDAMLSEVEFLTGG